MPIYAYKGLDSSGKTVAGELDAAERRLAVQRLSGMGVRPISIGLKGIEGQSRPTKGKATNGSVAAAEAEQENFFKSSETAAKKRFTLLPVKKPKGSALALSFLQRLLMLLSAGFPLGDALKLLSARLADPTLRDLSTTLWKRLSEGSTLSRAMADMPELFNESVIHLVEAGEASGNLVPILERIVAYMEEAAEMRRKVISNISYPIFICCMAFGVIVFFLLYLLPKIQGMIDTLGGEMKPMARLLIEGSDALVRYGPFALVAIIIVWGGLMSWRKTPAGRSSTDLWLLRIPYIGQIYLYSSIFQTSILMATLMASGINTTETLRLIEKTIANRTLRGKFAVARKQIQEGVSMATAIRRVRYMPDMAMDILTVGENTGTLVNSLKEINKIYRRELTDKLSALTTGISTGALIFAFGLVAIIALAMVSSIFEVSKTLQG